ncbi:bifunctional ADP-dependent NAD(P)H-hydrate dehydratase/NAD(P)H-hydrate epimerase [soil metagenome]
MPQPDSTCHVFGRVSVPLPTAAEAAAEDRRAREELGVPERVLMENAGRGAALVLHRLYPRGRIVGVAGSGNNGGDLVVMLRVLQAWGREVAVIAAGSRPPDVDLMHGAQLRGAWDVAAEDTGAERLLAEADVVVDGMLGTGSAGPPRGRIADWIGRINAAGRPVLALDLPSGVDATTGRVEGVAVRAGTTVTFGWPKLGLMLHPARQHCGRLLAIEIGFPESSAASVRAHVITPSWVRPRLRGRAADAHKGTAGRLLILAGSEGMAGAAAIAGEAALRAGAGLIRIASDPANRVILQTLIPEATFLTADAITEDDAEPMHAIVAGPGLGRGRDVLATLRRVLALMPGKPAVLDADALNVLATVEGALRDIARTRPVVVTPHARELSRLTGAGLDGILRDAPAAARQAAQRFGCTVVLKGQPTLIASPDDALLVNSVGSSDVATAGMGDQLAGVIGALLAGGADPLDAAAVGLFLSGRAADLGNRGSSLTPRDVSASLAAAMAAPGLEESGVGLPFVTFDQPARW